MNIVNDRDIMIFKNDKGKYSVGISRKKKDGNYISAYFPVQFNQGVEVENKTMIKIKNAWLDFYNWEYEGKKGTTWIIRISDFDIVAEVQKNQEKPKEEKNEFEEFGNSIKTESNIGEQIQITDEDLPF